ncbi:MAG: hypothetical protein K940chlam2_00066 [Chlamydiae bacterium]|nr:hypothetical protein [Chlamydiota bacterium]
MSSDLSTQFRSLGERLGLAFTNPVGAVEGGLWGITLISESVGLVMTVIDAAKLDHNAPENIQKIDQLRGEFVFSNVALSGTCSSILGWLHKTHVIHLGPWESPVRAFGYSAYIFTSSWRAADAASEFNCSAEKADNSQSSEDYHKARQQQTASLLKLVTNVLYVAWSVLGLVALVTGSMALLPIVDGLCIVAMAFWIGGAWLKLHISNEEKRLNGPETIPASTFEQRV